MPDSREVHRAQARQAEERAAREGAWVIREAAAAEHHEALAREGTPAHQQVHRRAAAMHRASAALHQRAAGLYVEHSDHENRRAAQLSGPDHEDEDELERRSRAIDERVRMAD